MNIGLFTSVFFNNIGNGFIDLGAEVTINAAKPEGASLVKYSQCANFAASMGTKFLIKENPVVNKAWVTLMQHHARDVQDKSYSAAVSTLDIFSVAKLLPVDILIIPGCVLTVPFFTIYGKLLEDMTKRGTKLVFLGASGNFYNEYEIGNVKRWLEKLKPLAVMTRDSVAYEHYKGLAPYTYNGIDNVFFVNRLGIPKLESSIGEYAVINLEEPKHQAMKKKLEEKLTAAGRQIVYTDHKPFPYSKVISFVKKKNMIISDYPMDYLVLYRNASEVFSDRVHACIPTLSFGNKAMLISDTPRKALFENVGLRDFGKKPAKGVEGLSEMQDSQIRFLKDLLAKEM